MGDVDKLHDLDEAVAAEAVAAEIRRALADGFR